MGVAFTVFAAAMMAGGLLASDTKGGARLRELSGPTAKTEAVAAVKDMGCGKCTDTVVAVPDRDAKGGAWLIARGQPVVLTGKHGCDACQTGMVNTGSGKATRTVAKHTCTAGCDVARK